MATMKTLNGYGFNATELNGKAPEYYLQPRNLLDNGDFTNPVNQRGQTSYTGAGYCLDRWRTWVDTDTVSLNDGYVSMTGNGLHQYIKLGTLKNTAYTLAVLKSDGALLVYTQNPHDELYFDSSIGIGFGNDAVDICTVKLAEGSYVWAALYEGNYTADTLPPYVPKGYTAELAECQRYYLRLSATAMPVAYGYTNNANNPRLTIACPSVMHKNPSIQVDDLSKLSVYVGESPKRKYTVSSVSLGGRDNNMVFIHTTLSEDALADSVCVMRNEKGAIIELIADL